MAVGNSNLQFGSNTNSVVLTLNVQNGVVAPFTPYVLIAGTAPGVVGTPSTSQYLGLTLGTSTAVAGGTMTQILNTNGTGPLTLLFGNAPATYYAPSYLFLYQNTGVDDIEVEVIPEPSTWALMLGGFGLLAFYLRRKNQRM